MHQHQRAFKFELFDRRRLTWYAAVFDEPTKIRGEGPDYMEVIRPGAFTDALATDAEVIANLDHDNSKTFAKRSDGSLILQEDPHGLFCSAWVPEGEFGDSILRDVASGKLDGCSFRFATVKERIVNGVHEQLKVTLADVCLTANPAYPGTEVHLRHQRNDTSLTSIKLRFLKAKSQLKG